MESNTPEFWKVLRANHSDLNKKLSARPWAWTIRKFNEVFEAYGFSLRYTKSRYIMHYKEESLWPIRSWRDFSGQILETINELSFDFSQPWESLDKREQERFRLHYHIAMTLSDSPLYKQRWERMASKSLAV